MDDTTRIKTEAELLRQKLIYGLLPVAGVAAWADRLIADSATPGDLVVELSMSDTADAVRLLGEFPGDVDRVEFSRSFFGALHDLLSTKPQQLRFVARAIHTIADTTDLVADLTDLDELYLYADAVFWDDADRSTAASDLLERLGRIARIGAS